MNHILSEKNIFRFNEEYNSIIYSAYISFKLIIKRNKSYKTKDDQ